MKIIYINLLSVSIFIQGCATTIDPYNIPEKGITKDLTTYYQSDFVEGKLKTLSQYDFFTQDSPCSAMPSRSVPVIYKDQLFEVELSSGEKVFFECRDSGARAASSTFRLFLIGTKRECSTARFDYSKSYDRKYQGRGKLCKSPAENLNSLIDNYKKYKITHP